MNLLKRAPKLLWWWLLFFLAVNTAMEMRGGTNPHSRFALLCSLVEDHSLRIDSYVDMTVDWARTPDGHYYSNKAPGPALLGLPIFFIVDKIATHGLAERAARDRQRLELRWHTEHLLSLLLQAVPFGLLVVLAGVLLLETGASTLAVSFFCAAALFGNTAAMYMNTFFGHGMAAAAVLGLALAIWRKRYALAGLCFGLSVLADFGSAMLLPAVLGALAIQTRRARAFASWAAGGILPGILWSAYHLAAFGSPFTLPTQFQNPLFVDNRAPHVWGVIDIFPHSQYLAQLLGGPSRGILFTQAWVLVAVGGLGWQFRRRRFSPVAVLALGGLAGLLWMNGAFGQWHAGNTPGPRYLSAIFPALALAAAIAYRDFSERLRVLLWAGLGPALLFFVLVFSTTLDADPGRTLWSFYGGWLAQGHWRTLCVRGPILLGAWSWLLARHADLTARGNPSIS